MTDPLQEALTRLRCLQHYARTAAPSAASQNAPAFDDGVAEHLTVVVSTSVIPSVPETALLEACFSALALTPQLVHCRKIVVCDGIAGTTEGRCFTTSHYCCWLAVG